MHYIEYKWLGSLINSILSSATKCTNSVAFLYVFVWLLNVFVLFLSVWKLVYMFASVFICSSTIFNHPHSIVFRDCRGGVKYDYVCGGVLNTILFGYSKSRPSPFKSTLSTSVPSKSNWHWGGAPMLTNGGVCWGGAPTKKGLILFLKKKQIHNRRCAHLCLFERQMLRCCSHAKIIFPFGDGKSLKECVYSVYCDCRVSYWGEGVIRG